MVRGGSCEIHNCEGSNFRKYLYFKFLCSYGNGEVVANTGIIYMCRPNIEVRAVKYLLLLSLSTFRLHKFSAVIPCACKPTWQASFIRRSITNLHFSTSLRTEGHDVRLW